MDEPGAPGCCPPGGPGGDVVDAWPPFVWVCALIVCLSVCLFVCLSAGQSGQSGEGWLLVLVLGLTWSVCL